MSLAAKSRRIRQWHWLPILLLVLINLLIGLFTVRDYGMSNDEPLIYEYAAHSLQNYERVIHGSPPVDFNKGYLDDYGPAFFMAAGLLAGAVRHFPAGWASTDIWHFSYFVAFQIAVISLYALCRRWMSKSAAFGAALLFSTQPLFWGHAFINPKDVPFMAFFLASLAMGLAAIDRVSKIAPYPKFGEALSYQFSDLRREWTSRSARARNVVMLFVMAWGVLVLLVMVRVPEFLTSTLVTALSSADENSWMGRLFRSFAQNAGSLAAASYVHKAVRIVHWAEIGLILLGLITIVLVLGYVFPCGIRWFLRSVLEPLGRQVLRVIRDPILVVAAILLGFTSSIRILGPYAGVLVGLYALYQTPKRTASILLPYTVIAVMIAYFTWPHLWGHPLASLIESIRLASRFPYELSVLFEGRLIPGSELPAVFLPKMISIQLTETALLLFLGGVILAIQKMLRERVREPLGLLIFWLLIPLGSIILAGSTIYDNFRQEFFLIPPIFICAGLALDWILGKLNSIPLAILTLVLVVAPGIYSIVTLHPYEYVYYNQLVGGVRGAFRNYELDYWDASFREAAGIVNQIAPPKVGVRAVGGPRWMLLKYSRPDISIVNLQDHRGTTANEPPGYQFAVVSSRNNLDLTVCKDAKVLDSVQRDGAILVVVKKIPDGQTSCQQ